MVEWNVIESPWSSAATRPDACLVGARPLLLVEKSVSRVHCRSIGSDLPTSGVRSLDGRDWRAFELAGVGRDGNGSERIELELGAQRFRVELALEGGSFLDLSTDDELPARHPGVRTHSFLGRHVDQVYGPIEEQPRLIEGCASLDLTEFLAGWSLYDEQQEARLALIVKIASKIAQTVQGIGERPRKVLRRRRAMERVASVRQIDPAGIRWLVRQPGNNLAQRAGPRQRVLAVIREESLDTLENRVVRDLLERSYSECRSWLRDNGSFGGTERYDTVQRYSSLVRRLRRTSPLAEVSRVLGLVEPNYVLQHDERYSRVWPWYVKLLRRQQEEDRLWRWSHRTFAEAVRLSVSWALDMLEEESELPTGSGYERRLLLRPEQLHGTFVDPRADLSGWLIGRRGGRVGVSLLVGDCIAEFEDRFGTRSSLGALHPDALVVAHDLFEMRQPPRALAIWSRLKLDGQVPDGATFQSLADSIAKSRGALQVHGLLVEPVTEPSSGADLADKRSMPVSSGAPISVSYIRSPLKTDRTRSVLQAVLKNALLGEPSA